MTDTIQTIRYSTSRFFSGTLLSRISGMLRDISMAYAFGTQPAIAAFMVAFRFALILRRLFGEGALQSVFIPEFESLRHQNEKRAFLFFRDLTVCVFLFLVLIIGVGGGILGILLWNQSINPANQEIIYLTLLMLPSLIFICLFGLNTSLLQCEKIYFIPSVAPVAFNGIWIISVLYLQHLPIEQATQRLAIGVIIACFSQWLFTIPQTWGILKRILSSSMWQSFNFLSTDLRLLHKPLALGMLGVSASQINALIDSLFARFADAEGPAFLWYAIRLQQLPLALFGVALAGALLPPLSRSIQAERLEEYHHFLQYALYRTWIFMLPLTALLFIMGDSFVQLLFGRGDFGPHSVRETTYCLWAYGIGLIPSALVLVLAPACYAQSNYRLPALASFLNMCLNIVLNTLFIIGMGWGAVSVAIATSLSAWVNFFFLSKNLSKRGVILFPYSFLNQGVRILLVTLLAVGGIYGIRIWLHLPIFANLLFSVSFMEQIKFISYQLFIFVSVFFLSHYLTKNSYNSLQINF